MAIKGPQYRFADGKTPLSADELNKRVLDIDARLHPLETKTIEYDDAVRELQDFGVSRIDEVLLPAYQRVRRLEGLGFLIAPIDPTTPFAFELGEQSVTVLNGEDGEGYRDLFTPSPFLAFTREEEANSYAIARLVSYSPETGVLGVDVVSVGADSTEEPATDVWAAGAAGSTVAQIEWLMRTIAAEATAVAAKVDAEAARVGAQDALEDITILSTDAIAARDEVRGIIAPSGPATPADPQLGQFWWDGDLTRVWDGEGWAPAVTASIGGLRMDEGTFGESPTGVITVGGGFESVMVWLNGSLLSADGGDYTEDGTDISLAPGIFAEGDEWAYWAYKANDPSDYFTKEEIADIAIRKDIDQSAQAEALPARINILRNTLQARQVVGDIREDAGVSAIVFLNLGDFRYWRLSGAVRPQSPDQNVYMQFSANNGVSWLSSGYTRLATTSVGPAQTQTVQNDTLPNIYVNALVGASAAEDLIIKGFEAFNFNRPEICRFVFESTYFAQGSGSEYHSRVSGRDNWPQARNAMRIYASSGLITARGLYLEGVPD